MTENQTLTLEVEVRSVSPEQADRIDHAVAEAVAGVVGRAPNTTRRLAPDYDGPGRSEREATRAAAEGRR